MSGEKRDYNLMCRHMHAPTGIDRQPRLSELHKDADGFMCARTCTGEVASKCLHTCDRSKSAGETDSHLTSLSTFTLLHFHSHHLFSPLFFLF